MKKKSLLLALATIITTNAQSDVGDLLITELSVAPFGSEFVEIYNNGNTTIILSDVYLTDATYFGGNTYYYQIINGAGGGGGFYDFHARFPDGASIAPGDYQTVSINGSTEFFNGLGVNPTYELYEDGGSADAIPDMRDAFLNSIATPSNTSGANCPGSETTCPSGLTDSGEVIVLYTWDGTSDLVKDLDYIVWGDKVEAIDKTGVTMNASTYLADTAISSQPIIAGAAHAITDSWQRTDLSEGIETSTGGNGANGHNETSENTDTTFIAATPSPNAETGGLPPPGAPTIIINEVDAVGTAEFIELYGDANTSLTDVKVVLYDGSTDLVYAVHDLSVFSTDANGYFLIGNATTPAPDITISANSIRDQDNAYAVAVYFTSSTLSIGDAITSTDIIDAFVYDSDNADDAELLALLNIGQAQVNENTNNLANTESNSRCENGTGGVLNTATYQQTTPTPGNMNNTCSDEYYASVTPAVIANPALIRSTLHNIIDNHTSYSYSTACDIIEFADEDPSNPNDVWMLYSNESFADIDSCAGSYNREHTWPNSLFAGDTGSTVGSDTHHLMATNKDYNSRRGSMYFDNCLSGCNDAGLSTVSNNGVGGGNSHGDSNWRDGIVFEVWDYRKGDIARAMFYMDVRYAGDSGEPDLVLTDDSGILIAKTENYMGKLSTLCEWHYADPVDTNDITRNEAVYSYQQNRNPFVDHPEWVAKVFASTPACQETIVDLIFADGFE